MIYLGINTNLGGGLVILDENQEIIFKAAMPLILTNVTREYDINQVVSLMKEITKIYKPYEIRCIVQKTQIGYSTGRKSAYSIGYGCGIVQTTLMMLGIPFEMILPEHWRNNLDGLDKKEAASIQYCLRRYPQEDFSTTRTGKIHQGICDAACIANYCYTKYKLNARMV